MRNILLSDGSHIWKEVILTAFDNMTKDDLIRKLEGSISNSSLTEASDTELEVIEDENGEKTLNADEVFMEMIDELKGEKEIEDNYI